MPQETMRLVLVRHGESEWNRLNLFTGWTDVDLTDTGRKEATAGGAALKAEGFDFDICYTSQLKVSSLATYCMNSAFSMFLIFLLSLPI